MRMNLCLKKYRAEVIIFNFHSYTCNTCSDFCFISLEYLCTMRWITAGPNSLYATKYLQITRNTSVTMMDFILAWSSWLGSIRIISRSFNSICDLESSKMLSALTRSLTAKLCVQCKDWFWWLLDWFLACTSKSTLSVTTLQGYKEFKLSYTYWDFRAKNQWNKFHPCAWLLASDWSDGFCH